MKRFRVEHKNYEKPPIIVTLHQPPYENENILYKTGYKEKDCIISELTTNNTLDLSDYKSIDNEHDEAENSLMGKKVPKKPKNKKGKK